MNRVESSKNHQSASNRNFLVNYHIEIEIYRRVCRRKKECSVRTASRIFRAWKNSRADCSECADLPPHRRRPT